MMTRDTQLIEQDTEDYELRGDHETEQSNTRTVRDEDLRPGDVLMLLGRPHLITEIVPYTHPTVDGAFGIARAGDGWGMSLWCGQRCEVASLAVVDD